MVNELRPYQAPKAKKCILAISQGCFPLMPVAVKAGSRRNADTRTVLDLKLLHVSSLERIRSVLYNKETTQEVICRPNLDWVSNIIT